MDIKNFSESQMECILYKLRTLRDIIPYGIKNDDPFIVKIGGKIYRFSKGIVTADLNVITDGASGYNIDYLHACNMAYKHFKRLNENK